MPRIARIVVPGVPYHITQRGNRREDVFFTDADRQVYLGLLGQYAARHWLAIKAHCLMSNHTHLVAVPATAESLCGALKPLHLRYAQHVNWTQKLCGRLWQGRFFSCALDEAHYRRAVRYVERNPVWKNRGRYPICTKIGDSRLFFYAARNRWLSPVYPVLPRRKGS